MDHEARDNFYLALDLDPSVDDWATIEARLVEKQREWSKHAVQGSPARQQEAKVNLKRIDQMRKDLQDSDLRKAIRASARKIKTAREAAGRRRLNEHIELLRTKGYYKREDLRRLHQDLGGDLTESAIEVALQQSKLVMADAPSPREGGVPARPRISTTVEAEIRRLLDQLKLKSLYELLEMSRRTDLDSLSRQADEVYRRYRPLTDPDSTARSKLAGHAKSLFSDAAEKQKYNNTIDVEAMHRLHGLIDSAGASGLINSGALERLVRHAIEDGVKSEDARSYIDEYARKKKWLVQPPAGSPSEIPKLCGYCSTLAHAPTDAKCPSCHEPLEIACPRCGSETPTEQERCMCCGFPTGSIPHLQALLSSGRRFLGERKYRDALGQFDRALLIHDAWEPACTERQRATAALDAIATAEHDVNELIKVGNLVHASEVLSRHEKKWGSEPWTAHRSRVEERLSRARGQLWEGDRLLQEGDSEAAWAKFDEALALSGDLEAARGGKAKCPPPPPIRLEIEVLPSGFGLAWTAPAAGGAISFKILRKEGAVPRDPEDGTPLPAQNRSGLTRAEDVHVPAGRAWHYAVFSVRDGLLSHGGAVAGPVIRTSEVEKLHASIGDRRVTLSWKLPDGARSVVMRRRPEAAADAIGWGPPLAVRPGDSRFTDAGLENEVTYRYLVAAVFLSPGGTEILSAGREVAATPSAPPGRVADVGVSRERDELLISWKHIDDPEPSVIVLRSPDRPTWEVGHILRLSELPSLGRLLVEVSQRDARDPAPDSSEPHYHIFAVNRLLAAYSGTAQFVEVRDLHASREDGHIVLRWGWPDGCSLLELTCSSDGRVGTGEGGVPQPVRRSGQQPTGLVRLPLDTLAPGRQTFRVRCVIDAGEPRQVAGPGRTVDALVSRSRELRWALKRRPFGLGATRLIVEAEDLSCLERVRLVGKVNERPNSPDDGLCLVDWRPTGRSVEPNPLVLSLGPRHDPRGETFCRLFIEPADLIRIDDPPVDRTVL